MTTRKSSSLFVSQTGAIAFIGKMITRLHSFLKRTSNFRAEAESSYIFLRFETENVLTLRHRNETRGHPDNGNQSDGELQQQIPKSSQSDVRYNRRIIDFAPVIC